MKLSKVREEASRFPTYAAAKTAAVEQQAQRHIALSDDCDGTMQHWRCTATWCECSCHNDFMGCMM